MDFFIADRQEGKTTQIIKWMRQAPEGVGRVCICMNLHECARLQHEYAYWDGENPPERPPGLLESWQFLTWGEVLNHQDTLSGITNPRGRGWRIEYAVDNADLILQSMSRHEIKLVTATAALH